MVYHCAILSKSAWRTATAARELQMLLRGSRPGLAAVRDLCPCPGGRWRERFDASERWRGMPARSIQNKFTPDSVDVQGPRRHNHRLAWRLGSLDTARCLLLMDLNWNNLFRHKLSREHRTWVKELMATRNKWAHKGLLDMSEEDRGRGRPGAPATR